MFLDIRRTGPGKLEVRPDVRGAGLSGYDVPLDIRSTGPGQETRLDGRSTGQDRSGPCQLLCC